VNMCAGAYDTLSVTATGGDGPYEYTLQSNNKTLTSQDGIFSDIATGDYSLWVVDENGCKKNYSDTIHVQESGGLEVERVVNNLKCYDSGDGIIDLNITGGSGSYSISWFGVENMGDSSKSAHSLKAGYYNVTVVDNHTGCKIFGNFTLTQPEPLEVIIDQVPQESGLLNGKISILIDGGILPYNCDITRGGVTTTQTPGKNGVCLFANLTEGEYAVSVKDSQGCVSAASVVVKGTSTLPIALSGVSVGTVVGVVLGVAAFFIIIIVVGTYLIRKGKLVVSQRKYGKLPGVTEKHRDTPMREISKAS